MNRQLWVIIGIGVLIFSLFPSPLTAKSDETDFCEFAALGKANEFGWQSKQTEKQCKRVLEVTRDSKVGRYALKVIGKKGVQEYGGIVLNKEIDLSSAGANDKISFFVKDD